MASAVRVAASTFAGRPAKAGAAQRGTLGGQLQSHASAHVVPSYFGAADK